MDGDHLPWVKLLRRRRSTTRLGQSSQGMTFLDAEGSRFSLVLVRGEKHEKLDRSAHCESAWVWAVPPALGGGDRAAPQTLFFVPLILPFILPVTCRPQARS